MKTDSHVTDFVKAKKSSEDDIQLLITDHRGKHEPKNKKNHDSIKQHIESYHPQVSHYRIATAPNRRYLDHDLTIKELWMDYKQNHNVSYQVYQRVFQAENVGFAGPNQDECDLCRNHKEHEKNLNPDHNEEACTICKNATVHKRRAEAARKEYSDDRATLQDDQEEIFTADMQKIVFLPKLKTKMHFFTSRLVVFNETFASLSGGSDLVVLWHEAISGRNASDVASSYIKCIITCQKPAVTFWADNCTAKNKNWMLFTALVWCTNQEWGPKVIQLKYLERGHTTMRADSIHGSSLVASYIFFALSNC